MNTSTVNTSTTNIYLSSTIYYVSSNHLPRLTTSTFYHYIIIQTLTGSDGTATSP